MEPNNQSDGADPTDGAMPPVYNGEDEVVVVETQKGASYVGHVVSDGPRVMRLMLTRPYNRQGRIVEVPIDDIKSVEPFLEQE